MGIWIIMRLVFIALLVYVLYKVLWKPKASSSSKGIHSLPEPMERDPVCGVFIPRSQAIIGTNNKDKHYFCSDKCRDDFAKNPDQFHN